MSPSFIAAAFVSLLMLVYWRATLLIIGALLLAGLVHGLGLVPIETQADTAQQVIATHPRQ